MKDLVIYSISVLTMVECLIQLNLKNVISSYIVLVYKIKKLFLFNSVSDYLKEKAARKYSEQLLIISAKLFTIMIASTLIGVSLFLLSYESLAQITIVLTDSVNIVFVTFTTTFYLIIRKHGKL